MLKYSSVHLQSIFSTRLENIFETIFALDFKPPEIPCCWCYEQILISCSWNGQEQEKKCLLVIKSCQKYPVLGIESKYDFLLLKNKGAKKSFCSWLKAVRNTLPLTQELTLIYCSWKHQSRKKSFCSWIKVKVDCFSCGELS